MHHIQRVAAETVDAVLSGKSLNQCLDRHWRRMPQLPRADRGAIQDLSYGTLRHLGRLRAVLDQLATRPISKPRLRALLLVALYQLEYSEAAAYAVVDHAVDCAGEIGGSAVRSFANAVLRNYQRNREQLLHQAQRSDEGRYSLPAWWVERLRRDFPADAERLFRLGNAHPPMTLRVNRRQVAPEQYLAELEASGLNAVLQANGAITLARPVPVEQLPRFSAGVVSVQDAGAQLAAPLLQLEDGMRVLDACAAPGGKAAHILETAAVELTALDLDPSRIGRIHSNLARLGLTARVACADAAVTAQWWDGRPFDRVLLDAPCSASGVVRRHPDIKWLRKPGDIAHFVAQQQRLLESLWKVVGDGGKLLYATCSIFSEENRQAIDAFVARHPDARVPGGMPGRDGLLLPENEHDGFYYALLEKD